MQSARMGIKSYAADLSMDGMDRRARRTLGAHNKHPQTTVALGALAAASVAAGTAFYLWPSGGQPRGAYSAEELPRAGALLGINAAPSGPSISFRDPLLPRNGVSSRAHGAGAIRGPTAETEGLAANTGPIPPAKAPAADRGPQEGERAYATARLVPTVQNFSPDSQLSDVGPQSSFRSGLPEAEASPQAVAVALASPGDVGQSRLNVPASIFSPATAERFLPILDGISAPDFGATADRLSPEGGPETDWQGALSAGAPVTTAGLPAPTGDVGELSNISAGTAPPALAERTVPLSFLGGSVERPAAAALSDIEQSGHEDRPSPLTTVTPRSIDFSQTGGIVDELHQSGLALAETARDVTDDQDKEFIASLDDKMGTNLAKHRPFDPLSGNEAPLPRGEEERLATGAPFPLAKETIALGSPAQGGAHPRLAHSGVIREDDRVAFARSESGGASPERVFTARMATISLASPADRASEAYADDSASTPTTIALADPGDGIVQLRLGDLIALLEDRMERPLFVWLSSAESASKYVTLETLRAAGIGVDYDAVGNHVVLSVSDEEGE